MIYVEAEVLDHPRTLDICRRLPRAEVVTCARYGEVFNRRAQSFRLQKRRPALILARKYGRLVLPAPPGYGVGGGRNYYFSHMLNCPFDCRYCFLQGMFRSAHHVVFVNYDDFQREIAGLVAAPEDREAWFFSGYDCDSLALEPLTRFAASFVPFFAALPRAWLELRTKSVQVRSLLAIAPPPNVVVAWSFTPQEVQGVLERLTPPVERRLRAMARLAERGWRLGLRFDPLIYSEGWREQYGRLYEQVFRRLGVESLHSVSLGPFRLPEDYFHTLEKLYPDEPLFAGPLENRAGQVGYRSDLEAEMVDYCTRELLGHVPREIFFPCAVPCFKDPAE
ncbi:MAG TPA: DNA photolyase [Thermoanaerobaculia bacterium]|nr:DNA photolyase [Thermoanaerobaculia bacterium]